MSGKLYIAYGSNLNLAQMKYRCPTAKFIGTGVLENYELQFKGSLHNAHATIAQKPGALRILSHSLRLAAMTAHGAGQAVSESYILKALRDLDLDVDVSTLLRG